MKPWIIILSGLPGSGKTTLAKSLAQQTGSLHLRIDTIEQALIQSGIAEVGPSGYMVAYEIARDHLGNGGCVVADCVNPIGITREAWREVALHSSAAALEVEVICSDQKLLRARVEGRTADIPGHILPRWEDVLCLDFEPWTPAIPVVDMAMLDAEAAARQVLGLLESV
jgi:predicted kinase